MRKIGLGLIGVGKGGRVVGLSLKGLTEMELVAVVATQEARATDAAKAYDARRHYIDYRAMLADDGVDAVFIATPNHLHCEMTIAAAEAGKHVLCEKPMALTVEDADLMIDAAERNKVKLMVGFTERYTTAFARAKEIIDAGTIGRPVMIHAKRGHKPRSDPWVEDPACSGGVLVLAGVHNIDLILWLTRSKPERLYAEMGSFLYKSDYIDNVALVMKLTSGVIASVTESYTMPKKMPHPVDRRIEVIGTEGSIDIDMMKQPIVTCTNKDLIIEDTLTWPVVRDEMIGVGREQLREFARCITEDVTPQADGQAGRLSLQVALATCRLPRTKSHRVREYIEPCQRPDPYES